MGTEDRSEFQADLRRDVGEVYEKGLDPRVDPTTLPALAELGEALCPDGPNDGRSEYYGGAIETILHRAIGHLSSATTLFRTAEAERLKGLTALFGIGERRDLGLVDRRSRSAPYLGYKTPTGGDVLKKATRRKNGTTSQLTTLVLDELAGQLTILAKHHGFTYLGRFRNDKQDQLLPTLTPLEAVSKRTNLLKGEHALHSARLSVVLLKELTELGQVGFASVVTERLLRELSLVAEHALATKRRDHHDYPASAVEALIIWAIERVGEQSERTGLKLYFGLGEAYGWPPDKRCRRASNFLNFDPNGPSDSLFSTPTLISMLRAVRDQLIILAAELEFVCVDYLELDADIVRLDGELMDYWRSYAHRPSHGGV